MELDEAAKKLQVEPERLAQWEGGEEQLTIAKLRDAATAYKRPLAVFFLPEPPRDFKAMRDFRRLPGVPEQPSPTLMQELRAAAARREVAVELASLLGDEPPTFALKAMLSEPPAEAAGRVRKALGVPLEVQSRWKTDYDALNAWRSAVEALGVLVFQMSGVPLMESRGFSAHFKPFSVVALNTKDTPVARCFTLMHELGHLVLREGAICDAEVMGGDVRFNPIEVWCNEFAAEVLVPTSDFEKQAARYSHTGAWPSGSLRSLAQHYMVSQEVVYRRLLSMGRASQEAYQQWRDSYSPSRPKKKKSSGGPAPAKKVVSNAGRTFVGLALTAYLSDRITASTFSGHLGTKLKHLPRIREIMVSGGGGES